MQVISVKIYNLKYTVRAPPLTFYCLAFPFLAFPSVTPGLDGTGGAPRPSNPFPCLALPYLALPCLPLPLDWTGLGGTGLDKSYAKRLRQNIKIKR